MHLQKNDGRHWEKPILIVCLRSYLPKEANCLELKSDPGVPPVVKEHINFIAHRAADWLIVLDVDREGVTEIAPLSDRAVTASATHDGDAAQWSFLAKGESRTLSFPLRRCDGAGFAEGSADGQGYRP